MLVNLRRSILFSLVALVFLGLVYPLVGTGLSQVLFPHQANGSLTADGSTLVGQTWSSPKWFHGRPDADNPLVANGVSGGSGASNLGPRSKVLVHDTKMLIAHWHKMGVKDPTPDLVTTSGSGFDPDISQADAMVQIPMIAKARHVSPAALRTLIKRQTRNAQWGFLGSSYIDVLDLNLALARMR